MKRTITIEPTSVFYTINVPFKGEEGIVEGIAECQAVLYDVSKHQKSDTLPPHNMPRTPKWAVLEQEIEIMEYIEVRISGLDVSDRINDYKRLDEFRQAFGEVFKMNLSKLINDAVANTLKTTNLSKLINDTVECKESLVVVPLVSLKTSIPTKPRSKKTKK